LSRRRPIFEGMGLSARRPIAIVVVMTGLAWSIAGNAGAMSRHSDRLLAPPSTCASTSRSAESVSAQRAEMVCLIAYARGRLGLPRLRETGLLDRAATAKLDGDLRCRQFTHTPCSQTLEHGFSAAGYVVPPPTTIGENLAWKQSSAQTPREVMTAWLESPEHRENLLSSRWRSFGLGLRIVKTFLGYSNVALWANDFSSR
jgi:uncharacterized protein YkwD